jgi:hypothetical protein
LSARRRRREAGARSGKQAKDGASSKLTEAPKESMHEKSKKQ